MTDVTRRSFLAVYTLAAALLLAGTKRAGGSDLTFSTLQPGATRTIHQNLNINIVFVGIRPGGGPFDVNEAALRGGLPSEGSLVNRFTAGKSDFGPSSPANVSFSYRYNIVYADATFENALFTYLTSIGQLHVRSVAQSAYNRQPARTLTIPNRNLWLNAVATERWLGDHATLLGIDPTEYTVFYLNWFGRSDFQFHSYVKLDERDIDTGFIAGFFTNRRMRAWGGTSGTDPDHAPGPLRRIWFADLSAGPDALDASYEITTADFDGDGVLDYRIPPIWEYGNTAGYRPFTDFTGDLVRLARYVAIDLLFTPSPLYPVALSPPRLPQTIQDDVNVVELDSAVDGRTTFNAAQVTARLHRLRPFNQFGMQVADAPLTGRIVETYDCYANGVSCYASTGPFTSLFIYDFDHLTQFLAGGADFEAPVVQYNTRFLAPFGLLGFATPSLILTFTAANVRASGVGGSLPLIHETGHLLGLSHPQDGYDPGSGVDFEPRGPFTFAGIGVESSTVMGFVRLENDFGQFNLDTSDRLLTAAYINEANSVLGRIVASPRAGLVAGALQNADSTATNALTSYAASDWAAAVLLAKDAYDRVLAAADQINVAIEPEARIADYKSKGKSYAFSDNVKDFLPDGVNAIDDIGPPLP